MATAKVSGVIRYLRRAVLLPAGGDVSDADLLESFISRRDEAAFEALVRRHGPMVLGVCRRILNHPQDAEDAFQATFLVLVRKAAAILPRQLVGHWLYGVAYRTAMKAKTMISKRRAKERRAIPGAKAPDNDYWKELQPVLDRELADLPEKYRLPIFLCDLEGKTHREAARQLGWPEGTLSTRLVAGRRLLARRLTRHGLTLSGAAVATLLSQHAVAASMPPSLLAATVKAGMLFAAFPNAVAGIISTQVIALAEGVLKAMLVTKLKIGAALCVTVAVLWAASNMFTFSAPGQGAAGKNSSAGAPAKASVKQAGLRNQLEAMEWQVRSVDNAKQTISVDDRRSTWGHGLVYIETTKGNIGPSGLYLNDLKVNDDATITLDDKPAKLKDLKDGMRLSLRFAGVRFTLARIEAFSAFKPEFRYILKDVDRTRKAITVSVIGKQLTLENLQLAENADIEIYLFQKGRQTTRKAALNDLESGMSLHLELVPDNASKQMLVRVIKAAK